MNGETQEFLRESPSDKSTHWPGKMEANQRGASHIFYGIREGSTLILPKKGTTPVSRYSFIFVWA